MIVKDLDTFRLNVQTLLGNENGYTTTSFDEESNEESEIEQDYNVAAFKYRIRS